MSHQNIHGRDPEERRLEQELKALRQAGKDFEPCEPPDLLDRAVMNMARRALPENPKRRNMRWLGAFATATVVVLAFSFVLQQDPLSPPESDGLHLEPLPQAKEVQDRPAAKQEAMIRPGPAPAPARPQEEARAARALAEPSASSSSADDLEFSAAADSDEAILDPEDWIDRLLLLHESKQMEQLEAELSAFREAYPGYPLPPALQD